MKKDRIISIRTTDIEKNQFLNLCKKYNFNSLSEYFLSATKLYSDLLNNGNIKKILKDNRRFYDRKNQ